MNANELSIEVEDLRQRLAEAEEALRAIRSGEEDALVVPGPKGKQDHVLESEEQPYRILLETMREGAVTLMADATIAYSNAAFSEILKTPLEHLMGSSIENFVAPGHGDRLRRLLEQGRAGKVQGEIQFVAGDGSVVWTDLSLRQGNVREAGRIFLVAKDISERERAEKALKASERKYRTVFEAAPSGILLHGTDGRFVECNDQACRLLGRSREEIIGRTPLDISPAAQPGGRVTAESADELISAVLAGQPQWFTWRVWRKDGGLIDLEVLLSSIEINGEEPLLLSSVVDITGRKKAEELHNHLASIVESSSDAIISIYLDGTIRSWNHSAEKTFGYSDREAFGKPVTMLVPSDRSNDIPDILTRIARGESVAHFETERIRKDGQSISVSLTISPVRDSTGHIIGASAVCRDITARRRTQDALRRSQEELTEAQRVAHLGSWSLDPKSGQVRWSRELYTIFGLDPTHPAPPYAEQKRLFTPDSWARLNARIEEALHAGTPYEVELETVRAGGSNGWVLARGEPARDGNAAITGLRGIAIDITQRKIAEIALRESEAAFHTLTDAMPQMVWMCLPDGLPVYVNRQWVDYTGLSLEESYGRGWNTPFHPDDKQAAWDAWNHSTRTGDTYHIESRLRAADGTYRWFLMRGVPERDGTGRIIRWCGTCTDIESIRQAEAAVRKNQEQLDGFFSASPVGMVIVDRNFRYLKINEPLAFINGPRVDEHLGKTFREVIPDLAPQLEAQLQRVVDSGAPLVNCEVQGETPRDPGRRRDWIVSWFPFRDQGGQILGLGGVVVETTEQKRADGELRNLNENLERLVAERTADLQAVLDAAPVPLWIAHDPQCRNITGNAFADQSIMRVPPGSNVSSTAPTGQGAASYRVFQKGREVPPGEMPMQVAAATGRRVDAQDLDLVYPDGRIVNLFMAAAPLLDSGGEVRGAVGAGIDVSELVTARQALRESEERLELALRASQEGVWDWNIETGAVWYSPRYKQMLGYGESDLDPHAGAWKHLLHPGDLAPSLKIVEDVLQGKREYEMEFRLRHQDGRYIHVLSRGFPVRREAGGPVVRIVGTHFDLTERKAAEEALRQSRERFFSLLDGTAVPLCLVTNGVIEYFNKRFTEVFGYTKDELPTLQAWWPLAYPDESYRTKVIAAWEAEVQAASEAHSDIGGREYRVTCKNGEVRTVEISGVIMGESFLANFFDVTARKRAEQALRDSEEQYRTLFNSIDEGFCTIEVLFDDNGKPVDFRYLDVNPSVAKHTGLPNACGKRIRELVPGVEEFWFEFYGRVASTGEAERFENQVADLGRWFDVYAFPIGEPGQKRVGVIFTDITGRRRNQEHQKETERELRRLNANLQNRTTELESANRELEAFSYSVSHDLRAPLRAMDGFSRTLIVDYADKLDDTGKDRLRRVVAASHRMDQLIDGILGLSRLARINLLRTAVNLSAMAETIAVELRRANPQRQVEFAIAPGIVANADATLLRAALQNLLGNAWKFTARHVCARIEVGTTRHEGEDAYFVRDDGAGFDMAYADKLFGPFQRLHTSEEFEGTGIGLTTVQRIIRRHGGRIWAQAEVEKGAAFFFTLPVNSRGSNEQTPDTAG